MKKKIIEEKPDYTKFVLPIFLILMFGAGLFGVSTYLGYTKGFMTDGQCNDMITDAMVYGYDTALFQILNETLRCEEPVPINVGNQTYNIFAVECLQGVQNG